MYIAGLRFFVLEIWLIPSVWKNNQGSEPTRKSFVKSLGKSSKKKILGSLHSMWVAVSQNSLSPQPLKNGRF
jgi:hypothetical protein